MKLATVVGARPQFVKAAAIHGALVARQDQRADIESILIHTGQHYDEALSRVFFDELGLPEPNYNLRIGSGPHGAQTGRMLENIEAVLSDEHPQVVIVYGDTNSTLAAALAAAKLHIPIAHVEAGLRSYNRAMPEEVNRVLTDHVSKWLFCPTETAVSNLHKEGIRRGVELVGDVMYELVMNHSKADRALPVGWENFLNGSEEFVLATIHRAENTDHCERLDNILEGLCQISAEIPVVLPVHPRTRAVMSNRKQPRTQRLHIVPPLGYLEMVSVERRARVVITDSGGVQKESYWLGTPCITVRPETEWPETLTDGRNELVQALPEKLMEAFKRQSRRGRIEMPHVSLSAAASAMVQSIMTADH